MISEKTLATQLRALETQLSVLKAQLRKLSTQTQPKSFADLYGILEGRVSSSEEEIDAIQYGFEWEGREER